MKSARITGPNEPLAVIESDTPKPQGNEVLVKVQSVGVCHSDLHLWEGGYDLGDGQFMKVTDIPFAKVGSKETYINHEQMSHNKTIETFDNEELGKTKQISNIVYFDGEKTNVNPTVKAKGADNITIFKQLGYNEKEINELLNS